MSLLTTRLGIKKPQDPDPFLTSDFQQNYDLIDSYPGVFVCTQGTRPLWGSAQVGQMIFCTDTRILYEWTGSSWREPLVSPGAWALNTALNSSVTPPGGTGTTTVTYTVGTFTSSRACAALLVGNLDFIPPQVYYDANVNIVFLLNGNIVGTLGGNYTQQGDYSTTSGVGYLTSHSVIGYGTTGSNAVNVGTNTLQIRVTVANNAVESGGPTTMTLVSAGISLFAVNNSSQ